MALSPPLPGQVIRYAYLWWNEARVGREDATKDRPGGIVLTASTVRNESPNSGCLRAQQLLQFLLLLKGVRQSPVPQRHRAILERFV